MLTLVPVVGNVEVPIKNYSGRFLNVCCIYLATNIRIFLVCVVVGRYDA